MINKRHWVWLNLAFGAGKSFKAIVDYFGGVEKLYHSTFSERCACPYLTDRQIEMLDSVSLEDADRVIELCDKNNWDIVTYDDLRYPSKLEEISNPPSVLYVDGVFPDFYNFASIGVVGTRKASRYAVDVASLMAKGICECGGIVVSGGALGVDSAAHNGALDVDGVTVCVLGCGLGTNYLMQNAEMRYKITQKGAVISELPPLTNATRQTFPIRNRIISGLSDGLLVVEAGVKSGTLITAECALKQNRDIYAVPASLLDEKFLGTNKLLDEGAIPATSPYRILSKYADLYSTLELDNARTVIELKHNKREVNAPQREQVTFDNVVASRDERLEIEEKASRLMGQNQRVYSVMGYEFEDAEQISSKCDVPISIVMAVLTMLELEGLVESVNGKRYRKK